jgi:Sporulation and spore germination
VLLEHLLAAYAEPKSAHPLQGGPAVDDVFLLPDPRSDLESNPQPTTGEEPGQLAVINLHGSFVDNHPSGILVEALTVESIIVTLHAGLPQVTTIRFLVDGQLHDTLAGHADLLRTYPATETTFKQTHPQAEN